MDSPYFSSFLGSKWSSDIFPLQIEVEESKFTNFKFKPKIPCLLSLWVPDATTVGIAFCKNKASWRRDTFSSQTKCLRA